jgi:hypothetical protein
MFYISTVKDGVFAFPTDANIILPIACLIYLALAFWMAIVTLQAVLQRQGKVTHAPAATD